jgi:signal transduction histidine kinase
MGESYSEREQAGAGQARALLAQLLPGVDVELLVMGLEGERDGGAVGSPVAAALRRDTELAPPARELRRVRTQFALGEAARMVQHAINNPLTALLAEAQLLELEELTEDQRQSVVRMIELARRLVALTRRLDVTGDEGGGGGGGTTD